MLLPQTKEREYRFKLALRMGLPIFALVTALLIHTFIQNGATLDSSLVGQSLLILLFSIYFILYLIYKGFDVKITDDVSKTFTREYLIKYLKKEILKEKEYSLILISIDNLNDINNLYGIKNGDKVLQNVAEWIGAYFTSYKIENFPLGHLKGGDFIVGVKGHSSEFNTMLELMCLKSSEFKVDDIEVKISGSISDTSYSRDLDYIIENLFALQEERKNSKKIGQKELLNPSQLEATVINALNTRALSIMTQNVYMDDNVAFKECFVKLKTDAGKPLFAKSFMKVINKLGLGVKYDLLVLEELLVNAKTKNAIYAINISPTSLRNEKFLNTSKELLKDADIQVMFVLSEVEYYSHVSRYNSIIKSLKKNDALIAIDRLGSIHTSFLYLRELNIDVIRFDTYYSSLEKLKNNRSIIEGFNLMAKEKGIKSWIKNISDEKSLSLAKELQLDYIQGKQLSELELIL